MGLMVTLELFLKNPVLLHSKHYTLFHTDNNVPEMQSLLLEEEEEWMRRVMQDRERVVHT